MSPTPFEEPEDKTAPPKTPSRIEVPKLQRPSPEAETMEMPPNAPDGKLASWSDALGGEDTNPPFYEGDEEVTPPPESSGSFLGDAPEPVLSAATDMPEAPESPDDFSGDISSDLASASTGDPNWTRFERLLGALEKETEEASIPEKAAVLDAIRTLRTHPFVKTALTRLKPE